MRRVWTKWGNNKEEVQRYWRWESWPGVSVWGPELLPELQELLELTGCYIVTHLSNSWTSFQELWTSDIFLHALQEYCLYSSNPSFRKATATGPIYIEHILHPLFLPPVYCNIYSNSTANSICFKHRSHNSSSQSVSIRPGLNITPPFSTQFLFQG